MKLIFILILSTIILESCGVKSDPKYQGKIKYQTKVIS